MVEKILIFLVMLTWVTQCSQANDYSEMLGKYQATRYDPESCMLYLKCYPLKPKDKKKCLKIVSSYFPKESRANSYYKQGFISECERLAFQYFINKNGYPCDRIDEGPIFNHKKKAYLIKSRANKKFYIKFDYDNKQWQFIK